MYLCRMWNHENQIREGKLIGPPKAGGDLFDAPVGKATDLFVFHIWLKKV